ncbi:hypothetical protein [Saccharospirillum impatiens]|uniref:hypothetical protein n=1 Tax=Saccharospirillum impatiens TaxID=169438 RepID=UPI0003FB4B0C|nr:hypothetical protein [Saccharospirillum impatiens]
MTQSTQMPRSNGFNKLQMLVILLTPLLVMASSTLLYFSGWLTPDERVNKGILVTPVLHIDDLGLDLNAVNPDRQWLMVQTSATCTADCEQQVYLQRQTHVALGKNEPRMKRLLMSNSSGLAPLTEQYPGLEIHSLNAVSDAFREQIPGQFSQQHFVFIVDPLGNIPLYFTPSNTFNDQLDDLKKLLKLSTIG